MTDHAEHNEHPEYEIGAWAVPSNDPKREVLDRFATAYDPNDTSLPPELHEVARMAIEMGIDPTKIRILPTDLMNDTERLISTGVGAALAGHEPDIECVWGHEEGVRGDLAKWEPGEQDHLLGEMGFHGEQFRENVYAEMDSVLQFFTGEDGPQQALGALAGISWLADRFVRLAGEFPADRPRQLLINGLMAYAGLAINRSSQEIIQRYYTPLGDLDGQLESLLAEPPTEVIDLRDLFGQSPADGNGGNSGS